MAIMIMVTGSGGVNMADRTSRIMITTRCCLKSVFRGTISVHAMNMTTSGVWNTTPKTSVRRATNLK